ncbi:MAG TPA: TIGR04053 family radical SAM/SPASM domain-containing protein [Candidatus Dormibacteraeota bacterium]|nr:TIGR04053 family radical SAM/SPASM domain-containing protein [Candidatus Dormibacteraeota bacterium]
MNTNFDLNRCPLIVIWETTQACDLSCCHCRACAQSKRHPLELTTLEAEKLIRDVADLKPPIFILTGGDPLKRSDIFYLIRRAVAHGLKPAMTPSATPLLTREAIADLKRAQLSRMAVSLDGATPELHDAFRGVPGSFARTLEAIHWANEFGLPIQVNTSISKRNMPDLENMANLLKQFKLVLWSAFFLVPTGRAQMADLLSATEVEEAFATLYRFSKQLPFKVKTTEAQHYRRYIIQQRLKSKGQDPFTAGVDGWEKTIPGLLPINDGKGFVFVSHTGEICPSGFLPVSAGNVRLDSLTEIYRNSPLLTSLRDTSNLQGKCGACEFKEICGGSRARAYAVSGNMFAEDPCCSYIPQALQV